MHYLPSHTVFFPLLLQVTVVKITAFMKTKNILSVGRQKKELYQKRYFLYKYENLIAHKEILLLLNKSLYVKINKNMRSQQGNDHIDKVEANSVRFIISREYS